MREKLIELLQGALIAKEVTPCNEIADYLIDQGVIIPVRCKDCAKREFSAFDGCEWCDPCGYKCIDPEWYCPKGVRK